MVSIGVFFEFQPHSNQQVVSQNAQGHVVMPSLPSTDFVVSQAEVLLSFLEAGLDGPAHAAEANQCDKRDLDWSVVLGKT